MFLYPHETLSLVFDILIDIISIDSHIPLFIPGTHNCSLNNGLCSDFCLLKPSGYRCACPTGVELKSDGKNCDYGKA